MPLLGGVQVATYEAFYGWTPLGELFGKVR
jgi:hypothetical protein